MDPLKAPSVSSLISDRGSTEDSLLETLNLDLEEIYDIPPIAGELPSIDVVLNEFDSDIDSINSADNNTKLFSTPTSLPEKTQIGSILRHVLFNGISTQIASAAERIGAGLTSALSVSRMMIAIGTSHGYILAFDSVQTLKWCCQEGQKKQQGAVASLAFNNDDTRLLAGFSRGAILMINTLTGDVIRNLFDAVSPSSGILNIKWTAKTTLALALDSGGSVWSLSFTRRMGIRGCDSRCLFSGARGEVCALEPLVIHDDQHPFQNMYTIIALATLSKFFILMIRPKLKVIKYHMLNGSPDSLPLLSWQMVLIQSANSSKSVDPVLATGRGASIFFHQLTFYHGRINVTFLRYITLEFNLLSLHWLGPKNIACIERNTEILHLIDVRTSKELELIDVSSFGIMYSSSEFKGIATGGNVSPALALAGTYACYNTVVSNDINTTLYIVGKKSLHGINARSWSERLSYHAEKQQWSEAFQLAIDGYTSTIDKPRRHEITKDRILHLYEDYLQKTSRSPEMCLEIVIRCLIEINQTEFIWLELWDRLYTHDKYLNIITQHILDDNLTVISPTVSQALLEYWSKKSIEKLESIILKLEYACLDLHQAFFLVKNLHLYRALMHLNTKALNDYAISLVELVPLIEHCNSKGDRSLGNNILVYISSCLAGRGYPNGEIIPEMLTNVKYEIMRILTAQHSMNASDNESAYPYLRTLLKFDTRETLNVLSLAFMEKEFTTELGLSHRQRIINILLEIICSNDNHNQLGILCNFISHQITIQNLPDPTFYSAKIMEYITANHEIPTTSRQHAEKEQTFLNLLEANILTSKFNFEELLEIAMKTKCYTVARFILQRLKRFDKIIECFILSNNNYELFRYIVEYKNVDERKIFQQVLEHFQYILEMDSDKASKFVIEFYPICIPLFFKRIRSIPKLHFIFLQELVADGNIDLSTDDYDNYIELMCQYSPENILLDFLQNSNRQYSTDHALKICKEKNFDECLIFLYEKKGEYKNAYALALKLLKESTEDQAEMQALQMCYLCVRISNFFNEKDRELFWFSLIENVLSRNNLNSIIKQILLAASNYVDLSKLIHVVMKSEGSKNFGDIKHILIGILINFEYELQLLKRTQNILYQDLYNELTQNRQSAQAGIYCKSLKCISCQRREPSGLMKTYSNEDKDGKQMLVFSSCGHFVHSSCYLLEAQDIEDRNKHKCLECGILLNKTDSVHLLTTNRKAFSNQNIEIDLKLKAPAWLTNGSKL